MPLALQVALAGNLSDQPSLPKQTVTEHGVVSSQRGGVSLYTYDLTREVWCYRVDGWPRVYRHGEVLLVGPIGNWLHRVDLRTGDLLDRLAYPQELGGVDAVVDDVLLIDSAECYFAFDAQGRELWQRPIVHWGAVGAAGCFLVLDDLSRVLLCLEAASGAVRWRYDARADGGKGERMACGFPAISIVDGRVLIVSPGGTILELSLENGAILRRGGVNGGGAFLVTPHDVVFGRGVEVIHFSHEEFRETARLEYKTEVEPLYEGERPSCVGFALTEQSVIWVSGGGRVMGIDRHPSADGRRRAWCDRDRRVLPMISVPPSAYGEYMYYGDAATTRLLCYRSVGE